LDGDLEKILWKEFSAGTKIVVDAVDDPDQQVAD
jgi:hypothetical protein